MRASDLSFVVVAAVLAVATLAPRATSAEEASSRRPLAILAADGLPRMGVGYGPFRDGQHPGDPGNWPTEGQIREDLHLIAQHWKMLRLYGSDRFAETTCRVIRADRLDLKVMLGAWIGTETSEDASGTVVDLLDQKRINAQQVADAIRIANEFPEVVIAISVGNETQVSWSFQPILGNRLIDYVREVRRQSSVPVTVADDFMFWITPESQVLAAELDFIVTHVYAMWHGRTLEQAVDFTKQKYNEVKSRHPQRVIVIGETGWATDISSRGDQAQRIAGKAGESEQAEFYESLRRWTGESRIPVFEFEAFDENWKGGEDPHEVEKHWGLFRADRTPKSALPKKSP